MTPLAVIMLYSSKKARKIKQKNHFLPQILTDLAQKG
jgi:hypothetical protein